MTEQTLSESVRVEVRGRYVDFAQQQRKSKCAIACAMMDAGFSRVYVDQNEIRGNRDGIRYTWKTPAGAIRFIQQFDVDRRKAKAFTFTLNPNRALEIKRSAKVDVIKGKTLKPRTTPTTGWSRRPVVKE